MSELIHLLKRDDLHPMKKMMRQPLLPKASARGVRKMMKGMPPGMLQ